MPEIDLSLIDRRFEPLRLKDKYQENILLQSIIEKGIITPLAAVVMNNQQTILLDGFKRLRCAEKLHISDIPIQFLADNIEQGIINLIRLSNQYAMNTLEQAVLIDELSRHHNLSVKEISILLDRSKAWVSIRSGMLDEMSEVVKNAVFKGEFPVRTYLYTLRPFTRVNGISKEEADRFVLAVKGKNISTRDMETLCHAYFKGTDMIQKQIQSGNIDWTLNTIKKPSDLASQTDTPLEAKLIKNLELIQKYMNHIMRDLPQSRKGSADFMQRAQLLIGGIFNKINNFMKILKEYYDQATLKKDHH